MIWTIAWHEFLFAIKRKSYYLTTLGMPLIALAYMGLIALIVMATVPAELEKMKQPVGVIDQSGLLSGEGSPLHGIEPGGTTEIRVERKSEVDQIEELAAGGAEQLDFMFNHPVVVIKDLADARKALAEGTVRQVTVIPDDYIENGKIQIYVEKSELLGASMDISWLSESVANEILRKTDLDENSIRAIQDRASSTEYELADGEFVEVNKLSRGFSLGIPLAVAGLLILALIMNSSLLLASIAEEKENKVMEVILSSVRADRLLFGKVLGIVMAGVLQIAIWMVMVSIVPMMAMSILKETFAYEVNLPQLALGVFFVLLGFIFYGCLLAGMGSLGSSYKDCQQLSAAVLLCACVPMMAPTVFITSPNGMIARVLSMIPMFSPVAMMMRLGVDSVPWWEVVLSLVILLVSIFIAIKIAAKLFRAGTLMQGKRPGIGAIWKVLTGPA